MHVLGPPRVGRRALDWEVSSLRLRARGLEVVLLAVACAYVAVFAAAGVLRAIYPFPIDGIEPGAVQEVRRVVAGLPLYVAPELGYVPFIYGPLYFYLSAPLAMLTGSTLLGMRLVSLLASLGSIGLVVRLVRRETGSLGMGLVSGGLLAACNPRVDLAMDIGRMDALSLFLLLAALSAARTASLARGTTWRHGVVAGLLMGLSLLSKQSGVPVALALGVLFALTRPRQLAPFAAGLVASVAGGVLLLVAQSGSWPLFYLWDLPRRHEIKLELIPRFWGDVLERCTLPLVVGPFYLFGRVLARDRGRLIFYACLSLGLIGTAWISDSNIGGGRNVQLPGYAALAILFGLGLHEALRLLGGVTGRLGPIRAYTLSVGIAQFAIMLYNPRLVVPYRSDLWDGQRLSATLAALPGPIFAGSYQGYVGSDVVAPDLGAVRELEGAFGGTGTDEAGEWESLFAQAVMHRRFSYVIVDPDNEGSIVPILATDYGYRDVGPLFPPGDVYWAWRTGWAPKAEVYAYDGEAPPAVPAATTAGQGR